MKQSPRPPEIPATKDFVKDAMGQILMGHVNQIIGLTAENLRLETEIASLQSEIAKRGAADGP